MRSGSCISGTGTTQVSRTTFLHGAWCGVGASVVCRIRRNCVPDSETVGLLLPLGWQFAMGLLVESDAAALCAALWRLHFVTMYRWGGRLLKERAFSEWRQFVDECGSIVDPNDKAAGLLCVADATCGLDSPLAAASRYVQPSCCSK